MGLEDDPASFWVSAYFQGRTVMLTFQGVPFRKLTCKMGPVTSYKWDEIPLLSFVNPSETLFVNAICRG